MKPDYAPNNIYCHYISISLSLDLEYYFFLLTGIEFGGLSTKYLIKSFMTYDIDLSYFLESFSRKVFISSVVLKFKGTDLMSLLIHTM